MEWSYIAVVYYNYVGVAHIAHAHKNPRVTWHGLCALNFGRDVAISWEASGVILDCCRCITGVSCTKVLHLFNEVQIFGNLFIAHTIIELCMTGDTTSTFTLVHNNSFSSDLLPSTRSVPSW